jgi:CubicO group peptidase (beta-lactamase class C family)
MFISGSTTKAFVASAMSLLIDDNTKYPDLKWTTPISTLIRDDFVLQDEYATAHVTIEDTLSHRTGMPGHDFSYGGMNQKPRDVVRSLRYLPMTAELRTSFQYCNMMYIVASYVTEMLEGIDLGDFLKDRIWKRERCFYFYIEIPRNLKLGVS